MGSIKKLPNFVPKPKGLQVSKGSHQLTIFKNPKSLARLSSYELKVKRNKLNYRLYKKTSFKNHKTVFVNNLITDAKASSIPVLKDLLNNDHVSATKRYLKSVNDYKSYLTESGLSKYDRSVFSEAYSDYFFKNIIATFKKKIPQELKFKQSKLSKSTLGNILFFEKMFADDLHYLNLISNTSKLNIKYAQMSPIESLSRAFYLSPSVADAFESIVKYNISLNENKPFDFSPILKDVPSLRNNKTGKQGSNAILINIYDRNNSVTLIHEMLNAFFVREGSWIAKNEVILEFMTNLFSKKYLGSESVKAPLNLRRRDPYNLGFNLFKIYEREHGKDLSKIIVFLRKQSNLMTILN